MAAAVATREPDTGLLSEIARRRTFAILSHPDAGKTTLTEKLLLYAGVVHEARAVRMRRQARGTVSDWMELGRARGISISSTVVRFEYHGHVLNLLDTPGHADFSADAYRALHAVDFAILPLDAAKVLEEQTLKLSARIRRSRRSSGSCKRPRTRKLPPSGSPTGPRSGSCWWRSSVDSRPSQAGT